jgi:hypothetical protein
VEPPIPAPTLRYAAAAAVSIPKSDSDKGAVVVEKKTGSVPAEVERSQSTNPTTTSVTTTNPVPSSSQAATISLAPTVSSPQTFNSITSTDDPVLPIAPVPEPIDRMPAALADLVASYDATKQRGTLICDNHLEAKRPDRSFVNSMIDLSFLNLPEAADSAK